MRQGEAKSFSEARVEAVGAGERCQPWSPALRLPDMLRENLQVAIHFTIVNKLPSIHSSQCWVLLSALR